MGGNILSVSNDCFGPVLIEGLGKTKSMLWDVAARSTWRSEWELTCLSML